MDFNELNLTDFLKDRNMEVLASDRGKFSDGRPYVRMEWRAFGCTMHSFLFTLLGFESGKDWKADSLRHGIPADLLDYLVREGLEPITLRHHSLNLRCFGTPEDRQVAVNIMVGYDI